MTAATYTVRGLVVEPVETDRLPAWPAVRVSLDAVSRV